MLSLAHLRAARRLGLLAAEALPDGERAATLAHVERCPSCARELSGLRALLAELRADPLRDAEPPLEVSLLAQRVSARATAALTSPPALWGFRLLALPIGLLAALLAGVIASRLRPVEPRQPSPAPAARGAALPDDAVARLERRLARERAARYLTEAEDVLVTLSAKPSDCARGGERVDVSAEARRSRELLARRALAVELDRDALLPARRVLEDVEHALREAAALEACARQQDVAPLQRRLQERKLLMRIDLLTRELAS